MGIPVWKEVLCLGRHYDPRTDTWHEFKPANIKRAHKNFQKMRARGVPLPAIWEHQKNIEAGTAPATPEEIAEWKRNYARYTFAHILDSRINDRGNLDMLHDVHDARDAEQLPKVKYVSPKVYNAGYWDTKGGEYDGTTIAHVAATPSPVQFWQKPFELSDSDALYLAYPLPEDAESESDSSESCPSQNWSFDAWLDELGAAEPDSTELSTTEPPEEPPVAEESKEEAPKGDKGGEGASKGGGKKTITDVIKALREYGLNIPDEVEDEAGVIIAIKANKGSAEEPEPEPEPEASPDAGTEAAPGGGTPMLMSTIDKNPERRKKARAWAAEDRKVARARIDAAAKGDGKSARDPQAARKLARRLDALEAVEMSFTDDGETTSKKWQALVADIKTYEETAPKFKLASDGSIDLSTTTTEVARPNLGGETSEKRAQEAADWIAKGVRPAK